MILVDSSVWVDHFHRPDQRLVRLLEAGEVLTHALIIGELACGNLVARRITLELLHALPKANEASNHEVLALIERGRLHGAGLGVVDVHLLASMLLSDADLWTRDQCLAKAATRLRTM
ncbi:MAG: PIN domain-containing protein [Gemmatimonadaceae bacterium]|nr:PIN domain-containing protein [Gemmatimonadaceae bacterium]